MIPFSINCTTCQARLTVNSEEALGQILQCPKCNSMVAVPNSIDGTTEPVEAPEPTNAISDSSAETVDHYDSSDISRLIDHPATPSSEDQAWEGQTPPESVTHQDDAEQPILPTDDCSSAGSRQIRQRVLIGGLITICLVTVAAIIYVLSSNQGEQPPIASPKPSVEEPDQVAELPSEQPSPEQPVAPVEEPKPAEPPAVEHLE